MTVTASTLLRSLFGGGHRFLRRICRLVTQSGHSGYTAMFPLSESAVILSNVVEP